jgi:hypothetical protein
MRDNDDTELDRMQRQRSAQHAVVDLEGPILVVEAAND